MLVDDVDHVPTRPLLGAFSASESGVLVYRTRGIKPVRQFAWVDRTGRELSRLPMTGSLRSPALSSDQAQVAFSMEQAGNADIYVLDLSRSVPRRLTFNPDEDDAPIWSPDGRRIAFKRTTGIFEAPADGQGEETLLLARGERDQDMYAHASTRDGRALLYGTFRKDTFGGLYLLPLEGDRKPVAYLETPDNEVAPSFSPDNRWIAYLSNVSRRYEVYVQRYPSFGGTSQVSNGVQGTGLRWRDDGREVFYAGANHHMMAVAMKDGAPTGAPVDLFDLGPAFYGFAAAADGQRFLVNVPASGSDARSVNVVMNWPSLLKK